MSRVLRNLFYCVLVACAPAGLAAPISSSHPAETRNQFYMIGHAHIDPVWRWTKDEGFAEVLATFRSALDRMKTYPDVAMVVSSAQFYEWVLQADPQMFAEIQQRVQEGRWNLVSGWWVESDANCPGGESHVRQGLYGQHFFLKHFGRTATIGFAPDTFGHPWSLPQILCKQGLDCYFYLRPELNEKPDLPAPVFQWQGQDGSRLLTFSIIEAYTAKEGDIESRLQSSNQRFKTFLPKAHQLAVFYGVGNHGGGPTIATIEEIESLKRDAYPTIRFSSLETYVNDFRKQQIDVPTVNEELQHHARGCYSACSQVKLWNRTAETNLLVAEKAASLASLYCRAPYPAETLRTAWKKVLFNQFHDILAGSSIEQAYEDSRNDYGYSSSVAREVLTYALNALTSQVATLDARYPASTPFLVFNPCSWPVQAPIEIEMQRLDRRIAPTLRDAKGEPIPYQQLPTAAVKVNSRIRLVFQADLPPLGYQVFRLDFAKAADVSATKRVIASTSCLENDWVRISFDTLKGTISSYFDKKSGRELLTGPAGCGVVLNDWDDTWGHRIVSYDQEIGRFGNADIRLVEPGPERGRIIINSRFGSSTLAQEFSLSAHSSEMTCRVTLDWKEKARVFQLSFPTALKDGQLTYSIPYGFIQRPMSGEEEPGGNWLDLSGKDGKGAFGLALINNFACGYQVKQGDMRITVLHSTAWSHHNPEVVHPTDHVRWMEQGLHEFTYLLMPHDGDWRGACVSQRAIAYLQSPQVLLTTQHEGDWPLMQSLVSFPSEAAGITSIKMAEDEKSLIFRCVEMNGTSCSVPLSLSPASVGSTVDLQPAEIKTIRVPLKPGEPIRTVNLLEQ
ncbi:MAG: Mannosylglycerate hydrolase [bacterium ADurb.Bin478]|nr:MAG: Mannosylglycerate hydrolase [bacterium ADurb.Bin478]